MFRQAVRHRTGRQHDFVGTDEASLVERLEEVEIRAVEAIGPNPKLTRPDQLEFLESLLAKRLADVDEWQTEMQLKPMRVANIALFTEGLDEEEPL